ncbi:MAG TPA: EamA family transporter, partial [Pseudomonas sp.]|nr:EamA family transporter [Pseudomonas sp.]
MQRNALRADLMMLLTAMIWGSAFVAQRLGMDSIGPFYYSGLRFALATVILLPVLSLLERRTPASKPEPVNRGLLIGGGLMGLALAIGINLQQVGLLFTTVTNSGFIT